MRYHLIMLYSGCVTTTLDQRTSRLVYCSGFQNRFHVSGPCSTLQSVHGPPIRLLSVYSGWLGGRSHAFPLHVAQSNQIVFWHGSIELIMFL